MATMKGMVMAIPMRKMVIKRERITIKTTQSAGETLRLFFLQKFYEIPISMAIAFIEILWRFCIHS